MKQKNAFPPNFIHSLDSSHMMLTSLNCERAGITFVSVHDCYWTHASTVHLMNKVNIQHYQFTHFALVLLFFVDMQRAICSFTFATNSRKFIRVSSGSIQLQWWVGIRFFLNFFMPIFFSEFTDDGSVIDLTKRKLNKVLRQLPKTGNFDITQVLNSVYFFS